MPNVAAIAAFLEQVAPFRLAEDWDNVGLLVGHRNQNVQKIMTCLTVTPEASLGITSTTPYNKKMKRSDLEDLPVAMGRQSVNADCAKHICDSLCIYARSGCRGSAGVILLPSGVRNCDVIR